MQNKNWPRYAVMPTGDYAVGYTYFYYFINLLVKNKRAEHCSTLLFNSIG